MKPMDSEREKVADRLLNSSAKKFYDPEVDIDWSAPIPPDRPFEIERRCSLYGTHLWDGLSTQQRLDLGRHEVASIAGNGIFFELLLMKVLLNEIYDGDPTTRHVQYALTEIADECRHSVMFARYVERTGAPAYGPPRIVHRLGRVLPVIGYGPALYGAVLVAEEVLDRLQRESMADETVQPLLRMVNRIHVLEEARHVTFARAEVLRRMPRLSRPEVAYQRWLLALVGFAITRSLINPRVYRVVGLDPREAQRAALANPNFHETLRWAGERIMAFLAGAGLVGAPGMHWWYRSFLIAKR
ncbi:MAG TPA: diiron oxygenase [Amycolatopsis sp.]|nr:diiron oxygenase [Amycolatopsis sp.]